MTFRVKPKSCSKSNCQATYTPHRWGTMEAQRGGWFIQKNGDAWCPSHTPDWVAEWRAKKESEEQ